MCDPDKSLLSNGIDDTGKYRTYRQTVEMHLNKIRWDIVSEKSVEVKQRFQKVKRRTSRNMGCGHDTEKRWMSVLMHDLYAAINLRLPVRSPRECWPGSEELDLG